MILSAMFVQYQRETPVCFMARAALERLLDPQRLDSLFLEHAQQQYTRELLFSTVVDITTEVVLKRKPSIHAAYKARARLAKESVGAISVSDQAVYDKLQNLELPLSRALVQDSARQAAEAIRTLQAECLPFLAGYRTKIIDGNHLKANQHRLEPLRHLSDGPLPGTVLAIFDQQTATVGDVVLCEDAHAQERSLLGEVLDKVQAKELWIADRNFCTTAFLCGIADRHARFVIRQHGKLTGELVGKPSAKRRCETGWSSEQKIRIRDAQGEAHLFRRIRVLLDEPTQDGDEEIYILTNLVKKDASAVEVAELYRKRWKIEGVFLEIAKCLDCEIKALAYPKAALFCFCVGLMVHNCVSLLKAAMRSARGEKAVSQLSSYYLGLEIQETYRGMMVALPPETWKVFGQLSVKEFVATLVEAVTHMVWERYTKSTRGPKKKPPERRRASEGGHVSTARVLKGQLE